MYLTKLQMATVGSSSLTSKMLCVSGDEWQTLF